MKRYIFLLLLLPFISCTRYITETVVQYDRDSIWVEKRDSLYTARPDQASYINTINLALDLAELENEQLKEILELLQIDIDQYRKALEQRRDKGYPEKSQTPPTLNTDTLWVYGRFADAWGAIFQNQLYVSLEEGKEFDILLSNAITEKNHYKELYYSRERETILPAKASFWENFRSVIAHGIMLVLALIILAVIVKFKK